MDSPGAERSFDVPTGASPPTLRVDQLPTEGRRRVCVDRRQLRKSLRKGQRELFALGDSIYKVYDLDSEYARRAARIRASFVVVATLARCVPGVVPMTALLVDSRERVAGYRMPLVDGVPASQAADSVAACRALYLAIERVLTAQGRYWQDPKLSNFVWDAGRQRAWAVDLKQILWLRSADFDPSRMLNSPRESKLRALGLDPEERREIAALRRAAPLSADGFGRAPLGDTSRLP